MRKKIPEGVKKALAGECRDPQLAEVAANFVQLAGGPRAFARMLYTDFNAAPPGGVVRSRIIDMVLRAMKFSNESRPDAGDLSLLEEEDLEREAQSLLDRFPREPDADAAADPA